MSDKTVVIRTPHIPDHTLLRTVGRGSYGEVWLAQNVLGAFRAVKVIYRDTFPEERPFEREFEGIQRFEPISRTHPGLVSVLHVGRNQVEGYFYYVMELADDTVSGPDIRPADYVAKSLRTVLKTRGRLPLDECVQIGVSLSSALEHMHRQGLIHRDVKPSNIIFINGAPKFADIGLVARIGEAATFVGTEGYIPPEGPGRASADLYSLGKVIYEMCMERSASEFPELPSDLLKDGADPALLRLNEVILRACHINPERRFQSAEEMHDALLGLRVNDLAERYVPPPAVLLPTTQAPRVAILYKSNAEPDMTLMQLLEQQLASQGFSVFTDKHLGIGVEWAREIESKVQNSDAVIVLLSETSMHSEMIAYEVEAAYQAAQERGKPRLLPVRLRFKGPLPPQLAVVLDPLHCFLWQGPEDNEKLLAEVQRAAGSSERASVTTHRPALESVGGAVPLDSRFYVVRPTDHEFQAAVARRDSIVLVKGARQMGKTSLLARGLQQARASGARVAQTDFQKLNSNHLATVESFFLALGEFLADQLDLDVLPEQVWDKRRSPNTNFERYLRREVLGKLKTPLIWGLDEVDRLFSCPFGSEVFGLFRSWHNERALDPHGPWSRLTLAIAYATEAHLFITDINQSPFNVGTRLALSDFTLEQVADLNERYGSPLRTRSELDSFYELVGGQPYLVRGALNEMASQNKEFAAIAGVLDRDEGVFGDHLRRTLVLLARDADLCEVVRGVLRGKPNSDSTSFYRLRSAGLMKGDSPTEMEPRCAIYGSYLRRHLL